MLYWSSADFTKLAFSKKKFRNTIRASNSLDPDQDRHYVGPGLGPNCLQRLSADDKKRKEFITRTVNKGICTYKLFISYELLIY